MSRLRGFTIVELLIVISLIALLVGWATPQFLNFNKGQVLLSAADKLVADLNTVQNLAETGTDASNTGQYGLKRTGSGSYKLCQIPKTANNCDAGNTLQSVSLDANLCISATSDDEVDFKVPTGNPDASQVYTICFPDVGSYEVTVRAGGSIYRSNAPTSCSCPP